jgi:hypothetical protein
MSIITSVLSKLGFVGAIYAKAASIEAKLAPVNGRVRSSHLFGGRPWSLPAKAKQFQEQLMNQRQMNESLYRLPVAR